MMRQRFTNGRIARIGTWTLAAITSATAWIDHQADAAEVDQAPQGDGPPATASMAVAPAVPASPDRGLLIVRYEGAPLAPPPTIVRRVIVEESGGTPTVRPATGGSSASAPRSPAATTATPPTPPPPPAALPAPPPLQSDGS